MPTPSRIAIATSAVSRLLKEQASYHKELRQQELRIKHLEEGGGDDEDGNAAFTLKQERQALQETKAIFPSMKQRISDAVASLEQQLADDQTSPAAASKDELAKAQEVLAQAKARG